MSLCSPDGPFICLSIHLPTCTTTPAYSHYHPCTPESDHYIGPVVIVCVRLCVMCVCVGGEGVGSISLNFMFINHPNLVHWSEAGAELKKTA